MKQQLTRLLIFYFYPVALQGQPVRSHAMEAKQVLGAGSSGPA
jgi:hypothetical protein